MKNKIYKLLSIVLAIMVIFSCCSVAFTAFAEEIVSAEYYVSVVNGSNDTGDGTPAAPFATISAAIDKATSDGKNKAGETVVINVSNPNDTATHVWGKTELTFECDLILVGEKANTVLNATGSSNTMVTYLKGAGSLTLRNVKFVNRQWGTTRLCNKDVYLEEGCTWSANAGVFAVGNESSGNTNANDVQNIVFKSSANTIHIGAANYAATFANRFNFVYDVANGTTTYSIGCPRSPASVDFTTTFKNAMNFNIKQGKTITFANSGNASVFNGDNAQIQVINSAGATLSGINNIVKTVTTTDPETSENVTSTEPVETWILNNTTTSFKEQLNFTDTVGVYDVAEGYSAVAVKADDTSVVVASAAPEGSQDVVLDLREAGVGTYNIEIIKDPIYKTYYVSASATAGADGSADAPFATIDEAVIAAKAENLGARDFVTVKIKGTTAVNAKTVDGAVASDLTAYDFKLTITSDDTANKGTVHFKFTTPLQGDIEFKDVKVTTTSSYAQTGFYANGHDVIIGEGVTYDPTDFTLGNGSTSGNFPGQNIVIKSKITTKYFYLGNPSHFNSRKYTEDVNVTIDNADSAPKFHPCPGWGPADSIFNKNLNLIIDDAASITFNPTNEKGYYKVIGALNVILDNPATTISGKDNLAATARNGHVNKIYYVVNNTGLEDAVSPVASTVGQFKVNVDMNRYNVTFTDANGNTFNPDSNGIVFVGENGGEYSVTVTKEVENKTYYVQADATEGDGSQEKPLATIGAAINAALANGYTTNDNITVTVLGNTQVLWGGSGSPVYLPAHKFNLIINSETGKGIVGDGSTITLNGPVKFEDINVKFGQNYKCISFGATSSRFEKSAVYSGNGLMSYFALGHYNGNRECKEAITPYVGIPARTFYLGNYYSELIYKKDVTLTYDAASGVPLFRIGSTNGATIFQGNMNIYLDAAKTYGFMKANSYSFASGKALQVINNCNATRLVTGDVIDNQNNKLTDALESMTNAYYLINNNTEETITFTADAGVYTVSGTDTVYAYKDGVKAAESKNGVIDISQAGSGEYTFIKYRAPKTFNYTNASGTTIEAIIDKAIKDGAIEGDTVEITLSGADAVNYGAPKAHLFDVVIKSSENTPVYITNNTNLAGDTTFDGVIVKGDQAEHSMAFDGHNVTFTAASKITGINNIFTGNKSASAEYEEEQNVVINCDCTAAYIYASCDWGTVKYKADLNITLATWIPTAYMGVHNTTTYEGTVNINAANGIKFANTTYAVYAGGLNIISKKALSDYTYVNGLTYDVYTVIDNEGLIDFGDGAGKFAVNGEDVVRAIGANGYADSADGVLNLTAIGEGHYTLGLPHVYDGEETEYADYIDYRTALNGKDALNNFAAKVKAGEDVNVVYYGGSVTAGTGASNGDVTSWRGIISNWLKVNAPQSTVTNISSAIGGTGSHFGFYRLDEAVLAKNPDLLFIEFSINDYYDNQDQWNIDEDRAAMQMESIVRKVRTKAPDCDIVIVLTTDRDQISSLQNSDTLHKQARGHYKIAEKYGIPTLRVGHALADQLFEDMNGVTFNPSDSASMTAWSKYFPATSATSYDIVHPNDTGYQIYGGVVKEFMANSLLGARNADAVVTNHTVPSNIVNEKIWAGDPVFIQANDALNDESESLGGDEFTVAGGREYPYHASTFRMDDPDAVLKFKFTGTELSILDDQYSHHYKGVNVKIDGGEEKYVEFRNYKPTILASGLDNVEHTAEVRIAEVGDGGGHWVYGFFVRNEADDILKSAEVATYYVSATGTADATGTKNDPVSTIAQAIALGNSAGLSGRDFVTIKVKGADAVNMGTMPEYSFSLVIESDASDVKSTISIDGVHLIANNKEGKTDYKNIKLVRTGSWNYISLNDTNVTFASDVEWAWGYEAYIMLGDYNDDGAANSIAGQSLEINSPTAPKIVLSNGGWAYRTYTEDVNLTFNSTNYASTVVFGINDAATNVKTTFKKNVNINIKKAKSIAFQARDAVTLDFQGAVQIINSAGLAITSETAGIADIVADKWIITDKTGIADAISVTDVAGVYKVNLDTERYTVVATSADGTKTKESVGDTLDLTEFGAGDYTLTVTKVYEKATYYVSAEGNDTTGDGSLGAPYKTVMKAVDDANTKGLVATDDVIVNVIGTAQVRYGILDNNNLETPHAYTLTIQSVDAASKGTVYFGLPAAESSDGKNDEKWLMGDTVFKDIIISDIGGIIHANGYNVTLHENVTAPSLIELSEQQKTHSDEQTIIINNAYTGSIHTSNGNYSSIKFNEDVNIIVNNPSANITIGGTAHWGGGVTRYYKNFNVIVKQAAGLKFGANAKSDSNGTMSTVVDGAINLLLPNNVTLSDDSRTNLAALTTNVYEVVNALGNTGTIEFVDGSTGEYTVNVNKYYNAYVTDAQGNSTLIQGTDLKLNAAGKYIVSSTRKSDNVTYYAAAGGTGDGYSAESPLGSVNAVIEKAIEEGWNEDTLTVKLMVTGTEKLPWTAEGTDTLTAYNFNLIIDSETEGAKLGNNSTIHMAGNVEINNVKLCMNGTDKNYPTFALNGYDAVIGNNVTSDGVYWSFANGRNSGSCVPRDDQYVTINSNMGQALNGFSLANGMSAARYDVNLYVTYNVPGGAPSFGFGSSYGASQYNANVTIDIVNANGVDFTGTLDSTFKLGANAKVQIINRAGFDVNTQNATLTSIADKLWVIKDSLGELGTLTASATSVGTYTVEYDDILYRVVASGANTYEAQGTTLSVPVAGAYTVAATRRQVADVLFVRADGSSVALGTEASPFDTIASAISAAKNSDYGKGDTVTIKVMGETVDAGSIPTYEFDLAVLSNDQNVKTKITLTDSVVLANGKGAHTHFSNVEIVRSNSYSSIQLRDSNVTFDSDVKFTVGTGTALIFGSSSDNGAANTIAGQKVIINTDVPTTYISNWSWSGRTNTEDVNVVLNNADLSAAIVFNAADSGRVNGTTKYNKNLNLNIKNSKDLSFANGEGVTVNGGFQIINSTDIAITSATAGIADITGDKWIINNKLGADSLQFTETAGKFIIDADFENYFVYLTDASGKKTEHATNEITLEPGDWEISKVRKPREFAYTVSTGGELATIGAAINKAVADGYGENDTITLNVEGTEPVLWGGETNKDKNLQLPAHDFKLIIKAEDNTVKVGDKTSISLNGTTVFENITLNFDNRTSLLFDGNDVTIGSTVKFDSYMGMALAKQNGYSGAANYYDPVNVDLNIPVKSLRMGSNYNNAFYHEDVNITYNAATGTPSFNFGTSQADGKPTFNADLNFNIKSASNVNFVKITGGYAFGENAKIQVINSTEVAIDSTYGELANMEVPKWIITNKTGNADAVTFTENAGTYNLDLGAELKGQGYYVVITNNKTNEVIHAKRDSITLPAGEYTFVASRDPKTVEYVVSTGTLADAIQAAVDANYGYGDTVTIKLDAETIELGSIQPYNFNLVVESYDPDNKTTINVASGMIANNEGAKTDYKNVDIYFTSNDTQMGLGGANVTFDKNVVISGGWNNTIAYGSVNDDGKANTIENDQTMVLNGQFLTTSGTKTYINLSNNLWAARTYKGDVNLVVNNYKATPVIGFNAYYGGGKNGDTYYNRNINLNIKNAKSVAFNNKEGASFDYNTYVQLIVNANTAISEEDIEWISQDKTYGLFYYLVDKSFQRDFLETTSETGVFKVNTDLKVTATQINTWDGDGKADTDVDRVVVAENGILDLRVNGDAEAGIGKWEITTEEFFEDFDNFDYEDLATDWVDNHSAYSGKTEITTDGKLLVESLNGIPNKRCIIMNRNIQSLTQYVSLDVDPDGLKSYDAGPIIYARASSDHKKYYSLGLVNGLVRVNKCIGETNASGNYVSTATGWDTTGLNKRLPHSNKNHVTFNNDHNYRMGMSIIDKGGVAYVRAFVLNLNTNEYIFDEVFKDNEPLTYTGIGFSVDGKSDVTTVDYCNVYFDNFYFSTEGFRVGDEGQIADDINRDGIFDLRDLVYTSEAVTNKKLEITLNVADKNQTGSIDEGDLPVIRKELLTGVEVKEFNYKGYADAQADALREQILGSTSTLNGKVYTAYNNGEAVLTHNITGNIWYVSETGAGAHNGTSPANAWTLEELNANADTGAEGSKIDNKTIKAGDAVLFERGSEFRLVDNLVRDEAVDGQAGDYYGYLVGQEGVLYGAYGTGAKPKFIDSARNYAEADWTKVQGQENLWVVDAPEIIIDNGTTDDGGNNGKKATDNGATNIIFNDGAKIGSRRAFTYADNLYTMYKDGQFTYDESTGKLYLYSLVNPTTYDSIEVSRGISGMMWNASENNIVVDNLAFQGFAGGAMGGIYGTHTVTVTNCEVGYSGGVQRVDEEEQTSLRWGNAIGIWCGGKDFKVNHNWIYQTFDTAISPQGNTAANYDGFQVIGNLLEYNNCDIEIFDRGNSATESKSATWNKTKFTNNIMRFTTLGWGSRHADQIRGIQGVIRGSLSDASVVAIDWTNNIIDTPGMEIFKLNNTTDCEVDSTDSTKDVTLAIWKFGTSYTEDNSIELGTSLLGNNKYYLNPYVRAGAVIATDYMTMLPSEYKELNGVAENTNRRAMTSEEFYNSMSVIDTSNTSEFYWLGKKIS